MAQPASLPAFIFLSLIAIVFGLAASSGSPLIVLLVVALFLSIILIFAPVSLLWLVLLGGLVLAGVAELYIPAIRQARWGIALAAMALGFAAILFSIGAKRLAEVPKPPRWFAAILFAIFFALIAIFSGLLNRGASFDLVAGLKNYFQVWGLMLAFALLPLKLGTVRKMFSIVFLLGFAQLPFILHQHFFLVPQRLTAEAAAKGIVAQDILVGTFSGSMTGGGAGPAMAALLLIAVVITIALWRNRRLSGLRSTVLLFFLVAPIAIGEHKIGLILLPIGLYLVFEDKIFASPVKTIGYLFIGIAAVALLFVVFTLLPRMGTSKALTIKEYWNEMISYNIGDRGYGRLVLNRSSVYPFWLKHHQDSGGTFVNTLIGHGPGASKNNRGSMTEHSLDSDRYPWFGIGLTGLSSLLWDTGLLGVAAIMGFFISLFRTARTLVKAIPASSDMWAYTKGAEAGIAMLAISLLHNNMFVYEIGFQTMLMLVAGYVIYLKRIADDPCHKQKLYAG